MIVVLSPYTHDDPAVVDERVRQTKAYIASCLALGEHVISLVANYDHLCDEYGVPNDYNFWKLFAYELIDKSDEVRILKLKGWAFSTGLTDEIKYATERMCMPIYVDPPSGLW